MSLYADYVKERSIDTIVETEHGFATYRIINEGKTVYIVDIFVTVEYRKHGIAAQMADAIAAMTKQLGCVEMYGTVAPKAKGSTESLKVLIAYGMTLHGIQDGLVVLRKDI